MLARRKVKKSDKKSKPTGLVSGLLGSLLFCAFIVFGTNEIRRKYGPDDFIIAAIDLYLDIVNLFIFILQMLYTD